MLLLYILPNQGEQGLKGLLGDVGSEGDIGRTVGLYDCLWIICIHMIVTMPGTCWTSWFYWSSWTGWAKRFNGKYLCHLCLTKMEILCKTNMYASPG